MNFIDVLDSLHEEFAEYGKSSNDGGRGSYAIYSNPTKREMGQIIKEENPIGFRLLADKNSKKVYLFNANMFHNEAIIALIGKRDNGSTRWVRGYADLKGEIEEFYPVKEVLNVIDWADKNNALTWINKESDKKDYLEVKEKEEQKERDLKEKSEQNFKKNLKKIVDKKKKEDDKKAMGENTITGVLNSLNEVFVDFTKGRDSSGTHQFGKDVGIYKNPTSKDLRELLKNDKVRYGLKFLIDKKTKDIYLFSGDNLYHVDVAKKFFGGSINPHAKEGPLISGYADELGVVLEDEINYTKKEIDFLKPWFNKKSVLKWKGLEK